MENASKNTTGIKRTTLDYLESQIDIWNRTATKKKTTITKWRKRVFILVLSGTLFGLLSQQVLRIEGSEDSVFHMFGNTGGWDLHEILAILSALAIALSTFAGAQILTSDLEKEQLKSRSVAEAIKVQAYLYLMSAPPYSGLNREKLLYKRVEEILKDVSDITPYLGEDEDRWIQKFDLEMSFNDYIEERVNGQINGYYLKKAAEFQRIIKRGNAWSLIFGFMGVGVGAIGATAEGASGASMWIAFLSTAGASIGSYLYSNKYEFLMMSYVTTASKLELMSAKHKSMVEPSLRTKRKFVSEVESVFAMEHNSWMSEIAGVIDEDDESILRAGQEQFDELVDEYGAELIDFIKTKKNEAIDTIQDKVKDVKDDINEAKKTVEDKIEGAKTAIQDKIEDIIDSTSDENSDNEKK